MKNNGKLLYYNIYILATSAQEHDINTQFIITNSSIDELIMIYNHNEANTELI